MTSIIFFSTYTIGCPIDLLLNASNKSLKSFNATNLDEACDDESFIVKIFTL